ncbi:hypothetical protein ATY37_13835 [Vibrio cidicii]|uniref:LPP20 lipoprotein n=1 Tax=Vibrio cidicii TaxID=1763883 RepID=A0A151KYV4_9VIBR|nr:hypothetical protein ATY36_18130 [Vibrio cidicii]KYN89007.1 hypothetical protein ATY37_13835 [Vibrio cidicii]
MLKKGLIFAAVAFALSGCNSTQTIEDTQQFAQCTFPDAPKEEAPAWICDVMPKDLAAGAMGYAKKSSAGMNVMRTAAINQARVQLAAQFQTDVNNMFKQAVQSSVATNETGAIESVMETFESVTKNVVTRRLSNSKLIVSQVSPSGGLYVLVGMDQATFQANLEQVVDAATQESKLWEKFNSEKAAEDLTNALNSLKAM